MSGIQPGDRAPQFAGTTQTGQQVRLSDYLGKQSVVLYFYPKDNTSGCTAEACAFRDSHEVFTEAGAEVIGVSSDSAERHAAFAGKHNLPFTLLSDSGGRVRKLYGVKKTLGIFPGRVTFVIDRAGVIRHIFSALSKPSQHIAEAFAALGTLPGEKPCPSKF